MKILQEILEEAIERLAEEGSLPEAEIGRLVEAVTEKALPEIAREIESDLRKKLPSKLRAERRAEAGFVRRNKQRWSAAFDELEFMYQVAAEMGAEFVVEWNEDIGDDAHLFGALNHLHVKGLVTTREIICLMEGGYADGALARWRTLHELSVCSTVIRSAGSAVAERYLASFDFMALKAAKQLNKYAGRANLQSFTAEEIDRMEARCREHTDRLGSGLHHEFGWAASWLEVQRPNLLDLEEATGLDHWRPRYRWASQSVHGGYRPSMASLAMAEAEMDAHSIGPSNSGMVDPLHMTAISLAIVSANFLCQWPNADRLVAALILSKTSEAIGPLAVAVERDSLARARRSNRHQ